MSKVTCLTAVVHYWQSTGACAFSRAFGADCILRCGFLRAKQWNGPPKDVVSILDCALGWVDAYTVVQPGPVIHCLHGPESDPL
jgi:hypothetical protein